MKPSFRPTRLAAILAALLFFNISHNAGAFHQRRLWCRSTSSPPSSWLSTVLRALGDYTLTLEKPLGVILEENVAGGRSGGVRVESLAADGAAALSGAVAPGDVLVRVGDTDVSNLGFDAVMDELASAPPRVRLSLGDGLGRMNMQQNIAKRLTSEQAYFVDAVVREAVRTARRKGRLGDVTEVEIVVGAGFRDDDRDVGEQCLVRFFALFSKDGGASSSTCQVSATGVRRQPSDAVAVDGVAVDILKLSVAKDEGLGNTIDLV